MDIKIHEITKQYLDYIKLMKELDLEVAGEFVAMASTLIHIKSRMLLPQYDENGEVVENEDPRKELVQKLLEYQKYQEAAKALYERPLVGRDVWLRGERQTLQPKEEEILLEDNALFSLISSYRQVLRAVKKKVHQVAAKTQSIFDRIMQIKDRLIVGKKVTMNELITGVEQRSREVLMTFLSLLELGKMGFVRLYQGEVYSDIWVEASKPIEGEKLSQVEEYDAMHADQIAAQMMEKANRENVARAEVDTLDFVEEDSAEVAVGENLSFIEDRSEDLIVASEDEIATDEEIANAETELFNDNDKPQDLV